MSSFLGAAASGGGMVVLARNVTVSVATTAAQAIYTSAQTCVPMFFNIRSPNVALSATTSYKVGITGSLASYVATVVATSLPTTACQLSACLPASGATTGVPLAPAGVVYFSAVQVDPTATTAVVDLLGYLA